MTTTSQQLREAADEFDRLTAHDRIPALHEVERWVSSNKVTALNLVLDHVLAGHVVPDEVKSVLSDGRLRELWEECGGAVDRFGRAFIEAHLLPRLLRLIIEANAKAASS